MRYMVCIDSWDPSEVVLRKMVEEKDLEKTISGYKEILLKYTDEMKEDEGEVIFIKNNKPRFTMYWFSIIDV